ncbi:hypothetical protein HAHE_27490 [Haloferula helveola]|uniref:Uncharacterized protein n=1 Tax=Haloferula helveola TaxID=490095 RepID=A0ABM7RFE9_9BACT|nr:hypothetical protein HAHE_27490 [Haloferula helveola]
MQTRARWIAAAALIIGLGLLLRLRREESDHRTHETSSIGAEKNEAAHVVAATALAPKIASKEPARIIESLMTRYLEDEFARSKRVSELHLEDKRRLSFIISDQDQQHSRWLEEAASAVAELREADRLEVIDRFSSHLDRLVGETGKSKFVYVSITLPLEGRNEPAEVRFSEARFDSLDQLRWVNPDHCYVSETSGITTSIAGGDDHPQADGEWRYRYMVANFDRMPPLRD